MAMASAFKGLKGPFKGGMRSDGSDDSGSTLPIGAGNKGSTIDQYAAPMHAWKGGANAPDPHPMAMAPKAEGAFGLTTFKGRTTEVKSSHAPMIHGNKVGKTPGGPSLGFVPDALHAHLGHFKSTDVLAKGHNTTPVPSTPMPPPPVAVTPPPTANAGSTYSAPVVPNEPAQPARPNLAYDKNPAAGVFSTGNAARAGTVGAAGINRMAKSGVNAVDLANAGKMVRAARVARRENVLAAKATGDRAAVKAARQRGRADVRLARQSKRSR